MLKKTITYTNFNDEEVSEVFYFHLSHADLIELQMSKKGGMDEWLQNIIKAEDGETIMAEFKKLILRTYGKKSDDGARFIRNDALREEFESSEAFSELMLELCTNADAAAAFVNGVTPKNFEARFAKAKQGAKTVVPVEEAVIITSTPPRVLTRAEARAMDSDELHHLIAQGATLIPEE